LNKQELDRAHNLCDQWSASLRTSIGNDTRRVTDLNGQVQVALADAMQTQQIAADTYMANYRRPNSTNLNKKNRAAQDFKNANRRYEQLKKQHANAVSELNAYNGIINKVYDLNNALLQAYSTARGLTRWETMSRLESDLHTVRTKLEGRFHTSLDSAALCQLDTTLNNLRNQSNWPNF